MSDVGQAVLFKIPGVREPRPRTSTRPPKPVWSEYRVPLPVDSRRTFDGLPLTPGLNVDRIDVAAGVALAVRFGYNSAEHQMLAEYALMRHRRGEEAGAQATALSGGIDLTSWYAILAAGKAGALVVESDGE